MEIRWSKKNGNFFYGFENILCIKKILFKKSWICIIFTQGEHLLWINHMEHFIKNQANMNKITHAEK